MDPTIHYLIKNKNIQKQKPSINKQFYKDRILDLTNYLFHNDLEDETVMLEFNNYIHACVKYFYKVDFRDTFQEQHKETLETILEEPVEKEINIFTKMMPRKKINLPLPIQKIFDDENEERKYKRINI